MKAMYVQRGQTMKLTQLSVTYPSLPSKGILLPYKAIRMGYRATRKYIR